VIDTIANQGIATVSLARFLNKTATFHFNIDCKAKSLLVYENSCIDLPQEE